MTQSSPITPSVLLALALAGASVLIAPLATATDPGAAHGGKDRSLNLAELAIQQSERFAQADANGDQLLSKPEFIAAITNQEPSRASKRDHRRRGHHAMAKRGKGAHAMTEEQRETHRARLFERMDRDGSGELSQEEATRENRRAAKRELFAEHRFERLDADADGVLTSAEHAAPLAKLSAADANQDGELSREERRAARAAHRDSHAPARS